MTGYINKIFVVTISLFLFACGINEQIAHTDIQQTNGLFTQAFVDNNQLIVNTTEEIYYALNISKESMVKINILVGQLKRRAMNLPLIYHVKTSIVSII